MRNGTDTPPAEEAALVEAADAPAGDAKLVELRARKGYHFDSNVEGVPTIKDFESTFLEPDLAAQVLNKDKSRVYVYEVVPAPSEEKE